MVNILAMKTTTNFFLNSTVLMTIVPLSWQIPEVECFVLCMNRNMVPDVMFKDA